MNTSCHTCEAVIPHVYASWHICEKEPYKRDCILEKRPIFLRSLLIVATPYEYVLAHMWRRGYGVATISRLPKNIGIFCKRALWKRPYSARETYIFKEPTNHSHPIWLRLGTHVKQSYHMCMHDSFACMAKVMSFDLLHMRTPLAHMSSSGTHVKQWHTYEKSLPYMRMSHVTHQIE